MLILNEQVAFCFYGKIVMLFSLDFRINSRERGINIKKEITCLSLLTAYAIWILAMEAKTRQQFLQKGPKRLQ